MLNVIFFSDKGWKVLQDEWQKSWKCSLEIFFLEMKNLNISNEFFHDFCHSPWRTFHPLSEKNITFNIYDVLIFNFGW